MVENSQAKQINAMAELLRKQTGRAVRPFRADGYVNMLNKYGTSKDASEHYQFTVEPVFPDDVLTTFYEGNGLFAKIIDTPAEEAVKHGFELDGITDNKIIDFYKEGLDELDWDEMAMTAVKWARLFGGSIAVMLINDGRGIDEPLDWSKIQSIDDIRVYDRSLITPDYSSMFSYDPQDPFRTRGSRLGMPEYYSVHSAYGNFVVHESRCLTFMNGVLPENATNSDYRLWGIPEYVRIHRAIRDAELAHRCAPKMLDRSIQAVYKMKNLSQQLATEDGENLVLKRLQTIDMARGMLSSITIDSEGEDYDFRQFQFAGVSDVIDSTCNYLSALTSIPQTILFGRSPAGMNSTGEGDMENYYNYVERIQKRMLKSNLRYLLAILFQAGVSTGEIEKVPVIKPKFSPLWSMSELEEADLNTKKAQIQQTKAQTTQIYVEMQAIDASEVRKNLAKDEEYDIDTILDDIDVSEDDLFEDIADAEGDPETEGNSSESAPAATKLPQDMTDEDLAQKAVQGLDSEGSEVEHLPSNNEKIGSVGILVISDGKVLCGKRHNDFGYGLICGPGGHIEKGETPEDAAIRETQEEFGIKPLELIPLGEGPVEPDTGLTPMLYLCTAYEGEPECIDLEITNPQFLSLEEIADIDSMLFQPFKDSLKIMLESLDDATSTDGGPGSGNHGHKGVIGEIGGSMSNGGDFDSDKVKLYERGSVKLSKEQKDKALSLCCANSLNAGDDAQARIISYEDQTRVYLQTQKGTVDMRVMPDDKSIYVEMLHVTEQGKGHGTEVFSDMVNQARAQGFKSISGFCAGSGEGGGYNGYYSMARLGFDAPLTSIQIEAASKNGLDVSKVSDLMSSEKGRDWWKKNGSGMDMTFDLTSDSDSLKTFSSYINKDSDDLYSNNSSENVCNSTILNISENSIDKSAKTYKIKSKDPDVEDGGPGSGNHNHEGVEGQLGGSAGKNGGGTHISKVEFSDIKNKLLNGSEDGTKAFSPFKQLTPEEFEDVKKLSSEKIKKTSVNVPLDDLYSTQPTNGMGRLEKVFDHFKDDPEALYENIERPSGFMEIPNRTITVYKTNGKYVIADGNHRLSLMKALGCTSAEVDLFDFDEVKSNGEKSNEETAQKRIKKTKVTQFKTTDGVMKVTEEVKARLGSKGGARIATGEITDVEAFAGKGAKKAFKLSKEFAETFGGNPDDWTHSTGNGKIKLKDGTEKNAEIHWYECEGVGQTKWKIKKFKKD